MSLCPQVLEEFCRKIAMTVKRWLIISLHFSPVVIWKALFCCWSGCTKYPTHLGYHTGFLSPHPTPSMGEQRDTFPSLKLSAGTYIRQRNSICLKDRGTAMPAVLWRLSEKFSSESLEVCHTSISSALLRVDCWCCRVIWELSFWTKFLDNQLFASAVVTSTNKTCGPGVWSGGSGRPQWTEPKDRMNVLQKRSQQCLLELSLPCCGNPYYLYCHTGVLHVSRKSLFCWFFLHICSHTYMTVVPTGASFYDAWCILFLRKVTCKGRMDNWRKEEELLELHHLTSKFCDLLVWSAVACSLPGKCCVVMGCLFRMPSSYFSLCAMAAEVRWQLLWCIFAVSWFFH